MLALKVDAGVAVPPLALISLFNALTDIREMHNTGLSLEKCNGMS